MKPCMQAKGKQGIPIFRHTFSQPQENRAPAFGFIHKVMCACSDVLLIVTWLEHSLQYTLLLTIRANAPVQDNNHHPVNQLSFQFLPIRGYMG